MRTPLTEQEHERIRDLIASGPFARRPVDERLIALGLVHQYDDTDAVEPNWDQVGENGIEPYYESDGGVNPVSYPTIGQPDVLEIISLGERQCPPTSP